MSAGTHAKGWFAPSIIGKCLVIARHYPLCVASFHTLSPFPAQCGPTVRNATVTWLQTAAAGGLSPIRIDNANSYADVVSIGIAMANSGIARSDIFLLSKVGNGFAMGYNDTLQREKRVPLWVFLSRALRRRVTDPPVEMASILAAQGIAYVDAVLIHWPTATATSTDPVCNKGASYNATACRLKCAGEWGAGWHEGDPLTPRLNPALSLPLHLLSQYVGRTRRRLQRRPGALYRRQQLQL